MAGVNKVILVGHLGKDPDVKYGQTSGKAVCRFSLATTERFSGEDKTEWHNILCFDKLAEICGEYLSKGRQIYIEGRIQTRKWQDKSGQDRYTTEIVAGAMQMLGGNGEKSQPKSHAPSTKKNKDTDNTFHGALTGGVSHDDDMPF